MLICKEHTIFKCFSTANLAFSKSEMLKRSENLRDQNDIHITEWKHLPLMRVSKCSQCK